MSNSSTAEDYAIFNSDKEHTLVIFHSLITDFESYEHLVKHFSDYKIVLIDVLKFLRENEGFDFDGVFVRVYKVIEENVSGPSVVLTTTGLASQVAFTMGKKYPALVKSVTYLGCLYTKFDSWLKETFVQFLEASRKTESPEKIYEAFGSIVTEYIGDQTEDNNNNSYAESVPISTERIKLFLQSVQKDPVVSRDELKKNKIPNTVFTAQNNPYLPFFEVSNFCESIGNNKGMHIIEGVKTDLGIIASKRFFRIFSQIVEADLPNNNSTFSSKSCDNSKTKGHLLKVFI